VRPVPAFPIVPGQVPAFPIAPPVAAAQPQKKKERPLVKTPIPGTPWLRVKTTEGNTFYSHKAEKRSVWTVPEEIKDAVAQLEREEREAEEEKKRKEDEETVRAEERKRLEVERIKAEVKDAVGKRKAEETVPVDELVISKKPRVDGAAEDDDAEGEEDEEDEDEDDESDMEDWQREAAAQLAAEAEEEQRKQEEARKRQEEEEKERAKAEEETQKNKPLNMPTRVDLSIDEAKALFKVCTHCHHRNSIAITPTFPDSSARKRH
jgi:transcription elongation regulator 1